MGNKLFKEALVGRYDGVTSPTHLRPGDISGGKNVRKVSPRGGWKPRKGCSTHNSTPLESGEPIDSLHQYTNGRQGDYHFIAQCNGKLFDATDDPPDSGTSFGSQIDSSTLSTLSTTSGFSCTVDERWFYADSSSRPIVWGGDNPYPLSFMNDTANTGGDYQMSNFSLKVTDGQTTTFGLMPSASANATYIITNEICDGFIFSLNNANSNASNMTVKAWRAGAWAAVSGLSDGTSSGGKTLAQDGTVSWTRGADTMKIIDGVMGYAYQITVSANLSAAPQITSLKTNQEPDYLTNKWDGVWNWVTGCRHYDDALTEKYKEVLGDVTNESTSQYLDLSATITGNYLYIKTPEPATAFGLGIVKDYANTNNAQVDNVDYWDGDSWVTISSGIVDSTLESTAGFAKTGYISFNAAAITPYKRALDGDSLPGYWYRLSWDAVLSADVRIYMIVYASFPETLPTYDGCVEFKGRLFVWGSADYPNRLRYSSYNRPDCFTGADSGYTDSFGGSDKILNAVPFYNELIVFKERSVYLLEGFSPSTFGSTRITNTIGLSSPKTAQVAEIGSPNMKDDEPLSIALWQDVDGIYAFDGRKPRKISLPIDSYFNQEYSNCISANEIANRQAFIDPLNNEYHFLLSDGELVYNYQLDEWYPPWDRALDLTCGISLRGTDNRYYTYGGVDFGFVFKLEDDTTDKTSSLSASTQEDVETSTADADIRYLAGDWDSAHDGTTGDAIDSGTSTNDITLTIDSGKGSYQLSRYFCFFDLSSYSGKTITAASFALKEDAGNSGTLTLSLQEGTQAASPTTADFDSFTGNSFGTVAFTGGGAAFRTITLDAAGITYVAGQAGSTVKFCVRDYTYDYLDVEPGDMDTGNVFSSGDEATGSRPKLTITITIPSTPTNSSIDHSIKSRAIGSSPEAPVIDRFTLRRIWAEMKAQTSGTITTKVYRNLASSGQTQSVPSAISMVNSGFSLAVDRVDMSIKDCNCFQVEFSLNVADQEMTIYNFLYELESIGLMGL